MKKHTILSLGAAVFGLATALSGQTTIAYWAQNDNDLAGGGFGFTPASFPQAADVGTGFITLSNFNAALNSDDDDYIGSNPGAYAFIQSFGGNTANALPGFPGGGSLSPQGGADLSNNGMHIDFAISTVGFTDLAISWAQRGTAGGFASRQFSYSADGGSSFTEFALSTGALGDWTIQSYDLSLVETVNNNPNVVLRITLDGAIGATGNNRFDNIHITAIPEPSTYAAFAGLAVLGLVLVRRRLRR
ncbi:MAG: PEP-CTERM sorting domain-containing protein [Opitutales bacterium]|nr:PEP-CTERM sorting domain-containing protein [Opitutales bacterium]